ncbi:MAG: ATP-binding protein [Chloroflexota bacterium]
MSFWRQLRWRIVGANMAVIVVGVALVVLMAYFLTRGYVPDAVQAAIQTATDSPQAQRMLLSAFRGSIFTAVAVAGLGALIVGLGGSLWLARQILRPLREIATGSQRIAWGHYDERVAVPDSHELATMATNFNQMAETLEQIEQQRVALIANVSHELRTPLTGLEGYLEGMMDGLFPTNEETYAILYQEVRRLRRLVDDLQALSRVEAGQLSLQISAFDLVALVKRVVAQVRPQAEVHCLKIVTAVTASVMVRADADRVAQVLLNLLSNAIRYTPEGGCVTVRVSIVSESEGGGRKTAVPHHAQIQVNDDGIGIPTEALPYIFERFYRVDSSRARASGGSGIGLTIARHLVWAMGGDITVHSDGPGKGSTFTFTLPLTG